MAASRQGLIQTAVGRLLTWAVLFFAYAAVLALLSATAIEHVLLVPARAPVLLAAWAGASAEKLSAVPEALRGTALTLATSLALLAFRASPMSLRTDLGGVLFGALVTGALLALAATAGSARYGLLIAAPGLAAAVWIVHDYCATVRRVLVLSGEPPAAAPSGRLGRLLRGLKPPPTWRGRLPFVFLPVLSALALGLGTMGVVFADLGWARLVGIPGLLGVVAWLAWAVLTTPAATRVPLWSLLGWSVLLSAFVDSSGVSLAFAGAAFLVLVVNATIEVAGAAEGRAARPSR